MLHGRAVGREDWALRNNAAPFASQRLFASPATAAVLLILPRAPDQAVGSVARGESLGIRALIPTPSASSHVRARDAEHDLKASVAPPEVSPRLRRKASERGRVASAGAGPRAGRSPAHQDRVVGGPQVPMRPDRPRAVTGGHRQNVQPP